MSFYELYASVHHKQLLWLLVREPLNNGQKKERENKKGRDSPPAWRNQSTNLFMKIFLINYTKQIFDKRMRRFIAKMPGNC